MPNGVQFALRNGDVNVDRLLLETDAPFMYPNIVGKKVKLPVDVLSRISAPSKQLLIDHCSFKRNEPCSLAATCELIAAFIGMPADQLAGRTTANAKTVFHLN